MSKKLAYEKFYRFHNKVTAEQYLNTSHLAEKFETSLTEAQVTARVLALNCVIISLSSSNSIQSGV